MRLSPLALFAGILCLLGVAAAGAWILRRAPAPAPAPPVAAPVTTPPATPTEPKPEPQPEAETPPPADGTLPVPPFPPRIADGEQYDRCMSMIADDPEGAEAIATSMKSSNGGIGATHCQAMAKIAIGDADSGATMLETLAHGPGIDDRTRVLLLGQAAEARLISDQPELALRDATEGLVVTPDDPDLLFSRATANDTLDHEQDALNDLQRLVVIDPTRGDAFILRATIWLQYDKLELARRDIEAALALDPDDPDALLQRGVLRQRTGDLEGARADWIHARDADPNSDAAEQAAQNLSLLDSGPKRK
jgi:regulator of sirC expression with transglutaminase-like and TPR domain